MTLVAVTPEPLFRFPGIYVERLKDAGFEVCYPLRAGLPRESETIDLLQGASAVIAGGEKYSEAVLDRLPELRVIARFGVGYDAVDVGAATRRGVAVAITPDVNHEAVAEHTLALLLAATRSLPLRTREIRSGIWTRVAPPALRGTVLGIVGLGRIGRSVAVRAAAFGMKLLATDAIRDEAFGQRLGIEWADLDSLLARSDIVTLHAPLTPETRGMINSKTLARMKSGSFLINTARGALVVEKDLRAALESKHLAGAGLDVFEEEPVRADNPLVHLDSVVLSPHLGGVDSRSRVEMALQAAENVIELSQGRWPEGRMVNPNLRPEWQWNRRSPARAGHGD